MHALCSAHVSEGSSPPSTIEYSRARARARTRTWALTECKAASLDLSLEQPMQRGDRVKRCGWPCAQSFLESHTCAPPYGSWPTPLHPSVCLLAWCGFAAPLSTSTAERTDFQGFGTSSTRRAGPPAQARWLAGERTTHIELEMVMQLPLAPRQICYRDPDCAHRAQWPRPNLQWRVLQSSSPVSRGGLDLPAC